MRGGKAEDELAIDRLDESHVGHGGVELRRGRERGCQHRAEGEDRHALAFPPDLSAAHGKRLHRLLDRHTGSRPPRVAHRARAGKAESGGEHLAAFVLVGRCHHHHVRDAAQV